MGKAATFKSNLGEVTKQLEDGGTKLLEALARETQAEVARILRRGGRSGAFYTVPGTNVEYQASAPGEAPAPRTGDLANSYYTRMPSATVSEVYSALPQSVLEVGTATIQPRPHLRPSKDAVMNRITRILRSVYR